LELPRRADDAGSSASACLLRRGDVTLEAAGETVSQDDVGRNVAHDVDLQAVASETDILLQAQWHHFTAALKYADYRADGFATDTRKFWVQVEYAH
jgi:hypothetical protein